ncbi:MAG: T9SS type A sorting domain-containing protein [Ignavibacteriaceae bacterium]
MKFTNLVLLVTALLLSFITPLHAQWVLKNNGINPNSEHGLSIDAINGNNAICCFDFSIYKTTDGGENWLEVFLPEQNKEAVDISMVTSLNIFICTDDGKIFQTPDGGSSWSLRFYDTTLTKFLNYIEMFDENNGICMGDALDPETGAAVFLRTTDGGNNWININNSVFGGVSGDIWKRLDFVNINTGYFFPSGVNPQKLYKTTDGGINWSATNYNKYLEVVKFFDNNLGLAYDDSLILRTTDGGVTWEHISFPYTGWGNDFEFMPGDPSRVWLTNGSNLFFSNDTGKSWTLIEDDIEYTRRDIVFPDANNGWLLADNGYVYKYTGTVFVKNKNLSAEKYLLENNFPNPFNPSTIIKYYIPRLSYVTLKIFDITGREVITLINQEQSPGVYIIQFNSDNLSGGTYFYRLNAENYSETRKMVLLK